MDIVKLTEKFNMDNPEYRDCYGVRYIFNEGAYYNPARGIGRLCNLGELRRFYKFKEIGGKKKVKEKLSEIDAMIARVEENFRVDNYIPQSGWLPVGEQYPDGYDSLIVGKGFEKPEIADIPSPSFDAYEQILRGEERRIFRALLALVLKGLLAGIPIELPVLVLAGGKNASRQYLKDLIAALFGKGLNYASAKVSKNTLHTAAGIFWYVNDTDITAKDGATNFRTLRTFSKQQELIVSSKNCRFSIPAFAFVVMLAQITPECLTALPHPGHEEEHSKGVIVLSCEKVSTMPELNPAERSGYFKRLLDEDSKIPPWHFALDIQEAKFQSLKEYNIYVHLRKQGQGMKTVKPIQDIAADLEGTKNLQTYAVQGGGETNVMKLLARYRSKEIKQIDGEQWQLDFTNTNL